MQEIWVRSLVQENPTFHVSQDDYAHVPQVLIQRSRACEPQLLSPGAATTEVGAP